jgi:SAM-dependent methyltransferase
VGPSGALGAPPLTVSATLRWSVVRNLLDRLAPKKVLEIGCGQGAYGARIAARAEYVGVEQDRESWQVARERVAPIGGRVLNGTIEMFDDMESYDLVCAFEVLEHIEDDVGALEMWRSRLAPGGAVLVSVPAWPDRFGPSDVAVGHYRRYTPVQLEDTLSGAGYLAPEIAFYGWPLGYITEPVRNAIARKTLAQGPTSMEARTASSGRSLQTRGMWGRAIMAGATPFTLVQKLRPTTGVGLVGIGRV